MAPDSPLKQEFRIRDLGTRSVLLFPTRAQIIRDLKDVALVVSFLPILSHTCTNSCSLDPTKSSSMDWLLLLTSTQLKLKVLVPPPFLKSPSIFFPIATSTKMSIHRIQRTKMTMRANPSRKTNP